MTLIKYDQNSLDIVSNKFQNSNSMIIDNLESIKNELDELSNILYTPKSSRIIPEEIKYLDEIITNTKEKDSYFKNTFNTIKNEYSLFNQEVNDSVGGNHE